MRGGTNVSVAAPEADVAPVAAASQSGAASSAASAAATSPAAGVAPVTMFCPDHTQVCIPFGADSFARARDFYFGLLQMK